MIIPPTDHSCNRRFPNIPAHFFDDQHARTEHVLRYLLRQRAPLTLDGGREILWFCPFCHKPWYQAGRTSSFVCLSNEQLTRLSQKLGADVRVLSWLRSAICPLCAVIHLGGMPRIEEYHHRRGYRFTWEGGISTHARLFCMIYQWNVCSSTNLLADSFSATTEIMTSPVKQVKSILPWLKTLPDPARDEAELFSTGQDDSLCRRKQSKEELLLCGYYSKAQCPVLGEVLLVVCGTLPASSDSSPRVLMECWRQIAREIERIL